MKPKSCFAGKLLLAFDLPPMLNVGLTCDAFERENARLTLSLDGNNPSNNTQSVSVGGELSLMNLYVRNYL